MTDAMTRIWIAEEDCIGCRRCERGCPVGAIEMAGKRAVIDRSHCISCGRCATLCPRKAIHDALGIFAAQ